MKNDKVVKTHSIRASFLLTVLVPAIIMANILINTIVFGSLYVAFHKNLYLYLMIGLVSLFVILYVIASFVLVRRLRVNYIDGLYRNTVHIFKQIRENGTDYTRYPESRVQEIIELNEDVDVIKAQLENGTLISHSYDSSTIPLEYIDEEKSLLVLNSFKKYLIPMIYSAQNYRNALIEVFYDFDNDHLSEDEANHTLSVIQAMFDEYDYKFYMPNEDNTGFYIFLPHAESFSRLREIMVENLKKLSVSKKTYDGLATINARFSVVCYPYSNIQELFPDLRYAKRQGDAINIYLPNRLSSLGEVQYIQNAMNLNNNSRIMEILSDLRINGKDRSKSLNTITKVLTTFMNYLGVDHAGIIMYNDDDNAYHSFVTGDDNKAIFKQGMIVPNELIEAMDESTDEDCSYYFSVRSHCNNTLVRQLDKMGISSGYYFITRDKGHPFSAIYFMNNDRPLRINSYVREGLFMASHRIGDFLLMIRREDSFQETIREVNAILMQSNYSVYRIDEETHNLLAFSDHMRTIFKDVKLGEKCYKTIHGLDKPCPHCPLITSKKMFGEVEGTKYEVTLALNFHNSKKNVRLVVHNLRDHDTFDRFDKDLLIASFPSLAVALRNLYSINARGYLLVLRIDNASELLEKTGSEKYLFLLRQFIGQVKNLNKDRESIYYFDSQSIAVLLAEVGQVDVVNLVEQIYEASKKDYKVDDQSFNFNITYLPYSFPQSYPNADDFLKYALRHYNQRSYQINKDIINFPDGDYSRSASRNEFMLAVIDEQFGNKTFSVALQPMVRTTDKSIYGAEIFLRLSDNYRNMVFSADELIKTAARNGKISLISNALIKYIGELYAQFGLTVFKVYGFSRLTINTDFSYFSDETFKENIHNLLVESHLPRDFLGFEITEREIYNHKEEFKKMAKGILNEHIVLICDQYTGKYVSIEALKEIGFSEIKIDRSIVGDIEVNPKHLAELTSIIKLAESNGVKASLVGVENADQFILIRDISKNTFVQGYHFFRPLDKSKFIEELRKNK